MSNEKALNVKAHLKREYLKASFLFCLTIEWLDFGSRLTIF